MSSFVAGGNSWNYLGRNKGLKFGSGCGQWCQVLEGVFDALGLIEELKSPVVAGALAGSSLSLGIALIGI